MVGSLVWSLQATERSFYFILKVKIFRSVFELDVAISVLQCFSGPYI